MKKLNIFILVILFSLNFVIAQAGYYYQLDLSFSGQDVKLESTDILFSHLELENLVVFGEENYDLKIVDSLGSELYSERFSLSNVLIGEGLEEGGKFIESQGEFSLIIPYHDNAHKVVIYNQGVEMDSMLVSQYSREGFNIDDFRDKELVPQKEIRDDEIVNDNVVIIDGGGSSVTVFLWIILALLVGILVYLVRKK